MAERWHSPAPQCLWALRQWKEGKQSLCPAVGHRALGYLILTALEQRRSTHTAGLQTQLRRGWEVSLFCLWALRCLLWAGRHAGSANLDFSNQRRLVRPKPLSSGFRPNTQRRHVLRDGSETVSLDFPGRTHRVILPPVCNNSFWTKLLDCVCPPVWHSWWAPSSALGLCCHSSVLLLFAIPSWSPSGVPITLHSQWMPRIQFNCFPSFLVCTSSPWALLLPCQITLHLSTSPEALQFPGYLWYLFFLVSLFPGRQSYYGLVSGKRPNHLNFLFYL